MPVARYVNTPTSEASDATATTTVASRIQRRQHTLRTDQIILNEVQNHGYQWRRIAHGLGGRVNGWSDDVVRNRFLRLCGEMGIEYTRKKRAESARQPAERLAWSLGDDQRLRELISKHGTRWATISKAFGESRTPQAIRNRASRIGLVYS